MEASKKESSSLRNQGSHSGERRPLAECRLTVLPQELCEGDFKGGVRLFSSEPPHEWTGRSLVFEVAKRLLQEGKAQRSKNPKGVYGACS